MPSNPSDDSHFGRGRRGTATDGTEGTTTTNKSLLTVHSAATALRDVRSRSRSPSMRHLKDFVTGKLTARSDQEPSFAEMLKASGALQNVADFSTSFGSHLGSMPSAELVIQKDFRGGKPTIRVGSCPSGNPSANSIVRLVLCSDITDRQKTELESLIAELKEDDNRTLSSELSQIYRAIVDPTDKSSYDDLLGDRLRFGCALGGQSFATIARRRLQSEFQDPSNHLSHSLSAADDRGLLMIGISAAKVAEYLESQNSRGGCAYTLHPDLVSADWGDDLSELVVKYASQETVDGAETRVELGQGREYGGDEETRDPAGPPVHHQTDETWYQGLEPLPDSRHQD